MRDRATNIRKKRVGKWCVTYFIKYLNMTDMTAWVICVAVLE
jgi:hypothetical protein